MSKTKEKAADCAPRVHKAKVRSAAKKSIGGKY